MEKTVDLGSNNDKEHLKVADETVDGIQNGGRGLLHVPSRSSSQKIQPSPTSTGLSGVTASDPRDSIGNRSKGSKGSILGRRRNGSATSSKMSITPPTQNTNPVGNSIPATSKAQAKPKRKSIFSLLCCGIPDSANTVDNQEAATPANKVTKVEAGRATSASKPEGTGPIYQNAVATHTHTEKEALKQTDPSHDQDNNALSDTNRNPHSGASSQPGVNGELTRPGDARDQPLPELPKEDGSSFYQPNQSNPAVIVQAPPRTDPPAVQSPSQSGRDREGDVEIQDSDPLLNAEEEHATPDDVPQREDSVRHTLPPPPPVPQPGPSDESIAPESLDEKQQWLLPPIAPRFKGKKCLVLDLDETLVHSSFKVCYSV